METLENKEFWAKWNGMKHAARSLLPMAIKNDTCLYKTSSISFVTNARDSANAASKPHLAVWNSWASDRKQEVHEERSILFDSQTYMCNQASKTSRSWNLLPSLLQERKWPFADGSRNHFYIGMDWLESRTAGTHYSIWERQNDRWPDFAHVAKLDGDNRFQFMMQGWEIWLSGSWPNTIGWKLQFLIHPFWDFPSAESVSLSSCDTKSNASPRSALSAVSNAVSFGHVLGHGKTFWSCICPACSPKVLWKMNVLKTSNGLGAGQRAEWRSQALMICQRMLPLLMVTSMWAKDPHGKCPWRNLSSSSLKPTGVLGPTLLTNSTKIRPADRHKAGEHAMFTLIHNCGLVWSDTCTPPRWMTATELLMCQGFPSVPFIHDPSDGLSVFQLWKPKANWPACGGTSWQPPCTVQWWVWSSCIAWARIPLQPVCPLFKTILMHEPPWDQQRKGITKQAHLKDARRSRPSVYVKS